MDGATRLWARSNLRRRWVGVAILILLVGGAMGATAASAIGARRTATAFPRLIEELSAPDLVLYGFAPVDQTVSAITDQPQVEQAGVGSGVGLMPRLPDGIPDFEGALGALVSDGTIGYDIDRPLLLEGRLPALDAADEIMLDEIAAGQSGLGVGDVFPAVTFNVDVIDAEAAEFERLGREPTPAELAEVFTPVDLTVVGIGRVAESIVKNEDVSQDPTALLSPAYGSRFPHAATYTVAAVDLLDTTSTGEYVTAVQSELADGVGVSPSEQGSRKASFAAAIRPYWLALALFSLVFGLGSMLALTPVVMRMVDDDLAHRDVLRAVGASRRQLVVGSLLRPIVSVAGAAVVAAGTAVALSPRFPIGPAARAEPDGGGELHLAGLGAALLVMVLTVLGGAAFRAGLVTRPTRVRRPRPSRLLESVTRMGASPAATAGISAALAPGPPQPRRRLAVVGVVGAGATALAALTFGVSLGRLVDEPARFGWNWDVLLENYDYAIEDDVFAAISHDDDVEGLALITRSSVTLDSRPVPAVGIESRVGGIHPTVLDGRAPAEPGELALGAVTARDLGVAVGDVVNGATSTGGEEALRVVGIVVMPSIELNQSSQLGQGALLLSEDYRRLTEWYPTAALAELASGVSVADFEGRHPISVLEVQRPGDVLSYDGVRDVPSLLAAMLVMLAVAVVLHLLVGSTRARRSELAVLRTMGFERRQVSATVFWQATTQVGLALGAAVPIGFVAGRLGWQIFADSIGVGGDAALPLLLGVVFAIATVLLANAVTLPWARRAAMMDPARILRAE